MSRVRIETRTEASVMALLLFAAAPFVACQQSTIVREDLASHINALIEPVAEAEAFSGVILVARGDDILYHQAFGYANWELRVPNTRETRFGVADFTKVLTNVIVEVMVEEGQLDPDSPVEHYIEDFPRGPNGGAPTIAHLAAHQAGVPHRVTDQIDEMQGIDIIDRVKIAGLLFEPGTSRLYSSAGYVSLARVIEVIEDKPFDQVLEERIFRPAAMNSATSETRRQLMRLRASPYNLGTDGNDLVVVSALYKDLRFLTGAGSVFATAEDLFRYVRAAHDGVFGELYDWTVDSWRGHTGRFNGYEAYIDMLRAQDLTLIVVTNLQTAVNEQVRAHIRAYLSGDEVEPLELPPPVVAQFELPESVIGTYDDNGRPVTISLQDENLFRGDVFGVDAEFYPIAGGHYYVPWSGHTIEFRRDESGAVDGLIRSGWDGGDGVLPRVP